MSTNNKQSIFKVAQTIIILIVIISIMGFSKIDSHAATKASKEAFKNELSQMLYDNDTTTHDIYKYRLTSSEALDIANSLKAGDCRYIWYSYYSNMYVTFFTKSGYASEVKIVNSDPGVLKRYENVKKNAESIMAGIKSDMTDLDKVIYVHNRIVEIAAYQYVAYQSYGVGGILGEQKGVCAGYAKTMNMFMEMLGIESKYVPSKSLNHAWNKVKIDGEWYHLDATWDDTRSATKGQTGHQFLLCNDDEFSGWKSHVDWTDPSEKMESTSTRFSNWFVHDHTGPMIYESGYWYYVDNNTQNIMKAKATGENMQVIMYGTDYSSVSIIAVTQDTVTYKADGIIYSVPNCEAVIDDLVDEEEPIEDEIVEEQPSDETPVEEEPEIEEEPVVNKPVDTTNLTNWNDYSLWEMGKYDEATKTVAPSICRLHLISQYSVDALAKYQAITPADDLIMYAYELDADENVIILHRLNNGTTFTTSSNCNSLSVELLCSTNEWNYNSKKFKALFDNSNNSVGIVEVEKNATSPLIDTVSFSSISSWIMGQYKSDSGIFATSKTRMCLPEYVVATPGVTYEVSLNQEKYRLLVVQLDDKYSFISSAIVEGGSSFTTSNNCKFLAITLYSPSLEWTLSSSTYNDLFATGISIDIISPIKTNETDTEKDINTETTSNISYSWNDLSLWQSGQFDATNNSVKTSKTRIVLNEKVTVKSSEEYTVTMTAPDLGVLIYELDTAGNAIISHALTNGDCFTTASGCAAISLELYCPSNEWKYAYKNYKALFDSSSISISLTQTDTQANSIISKRTWNSLVGWRSGQYKTETGIYAIGAKTRVCLTDYLVVSPNANYSISLNDDRYRLHIVQLDATYHYICDCVVSDASYFTASANCRYVGITLYSPALEWTLNYASYETLFADGLSVSIEPTSVPVESTTSDSTEDINSDSSEDIDSGSTEDISEPTNNEIVEDVIPSEVPQLPDNEMASVDSHMWNDITFWKIGEYSNSTAEYYSDVECRICLNDYFIAEPNTCYDVTLTNGTYKMLAYQLDSNNTIISMAELGNGDSFETSPSCVALAITIFNAELNRDATYANFEDMFNNGVQIGLSRILNIDDTDVPAAATIPSSSNYSLKVFVPYVTVALIAVVSISLVVVKKKNRL